MKKQEETESITLIKNIPYCESIRGENPALDAWLPVKPGKILPACLLLHGGGWTTGDKGDERERNMAKKLCKMGYAAFSANYHMALYEEGPYRGRRLQSAWPKCIEDCMEAVSFIRRNANQFSIDPEKIAVIGSSAGGHLALWLATEKSCGISCAIALYPVPDTSPTVSSLPTCWRTAWVPPLRRRMLWTRLRSTYPSAGSRRSRSRPSPRSW